MLNVWGYLRGTTDQGSIDPADPRNRCIPKQMSSNYLALVI